MAPLSLCVSARPCHRCQLVDHRRPVVIPSEAEPGLLALCISRQSSAARRCTPHSRGADGPRRLRGRARFRCGQDRSGSRRLRCVPPSASRARHADRSRRPVRSPCRTLTGTQFQWRHRDESRYRRVRGHVEKRPPTISRGTSAASAGGSTDARSGSRGRSRGPRSRCASPRPSSTPRAWSDHR